jgi:hypothetical protein
MRYPALLLAAFACLLSMPAMAKPEGHPLTIYVDLTPICGAGRIAEGERRRTESAARRYARGERAKGRDVRIVKLLDPAARIGALTGHGGEATGIPIFAPTC